MLPRLALLIELKLRLKGQVDLERILPMISALATGFLMRVLLQH